MRIRTVLIGIGLAGNLLLALSLFFLFNYRDATQKEFANESLVSTYEAAWFQTLETSFDAISAWLPITGERGNYWDPENPIYPEEELSSPDDSYANPLIQFVTDKNIGEAGYLLDLMFEFDLDEGNLSFIKAYYPDGQRFIVLVRWIYLESMLVTPKRKMNTMRILMNFSLMQERDRGGFYKRS